jgi:hypothetical protein
VLQGFDGEMWGEKTSGRPRSRWKRNTKIGHQEGWWGHGLYWYLIQYRDRSRALVNAVMNPRVPWSSINFLTSWLSANVSMTLLHWLLFQICVQTQLLKCSEIHFRLVNNVVMQQAPKLCELTSYFQFWRSWVPFPPCRLALLFTN